MYTYTEIIIKDADPTLDFETKLVLCCEPDGSFNLEIWQEKDLIYIAADALQAFKEAVNKLIP